MENQLISILKEAFTFFQKSTFKAVNFESVFLHLLTNQRWPAQFKISYRFADDNIWIAAKIL